MTFLLGLLYQDGRGKSILEQVSSKRISLEEATKMAKTEALERSAELERSNPDARPAPRHYAREVDGQRTPFEFVSLAPSTFGKIRAASGVSPAEYGLSFETPPSGNLAGGASGSFVKKSHDSRLIIKSIDKTETEVRFSLCSPFGSIHLVVDQTPLFFKTLPSSLTTNIPSFNQNPTNSIFLEFPFTVFRFCSECSSPTSRTWKHRHTRC